MVYSWHVIAAITGVLCAVGTTCATLWFIDLRYRRALQHLNDGRLVKDDLYGMASTAILGMGTAVGLTVGALNLIGNLGSDSLRSVLTAALATPVLLGIVYLVRQPPRSRDASRAERAPPA